MAPEESDQNYWPKRAAIISGIIAVALFIVIIRTSNEGVGGLAILLLAIPFLVFITARRYIRNRTTDVLASKAVLESGKAPVLYLRPFSQDDEVGLYYVFLPYNPWTWKLLLRPAGLFRSYGLLFTMRFSFERLLQRACRNVGPVIGIGEPGDKLPSSGMITEYVGDDWQSRVRELIEASQLVVLRAGITEGLMWEVDVIAKLVPPQKLLVYVGNGAGRRSTFAWWIGWVRVSKRKRRKFYADFRAISREHFPKPLPESIGMHKFIRFDSDWSPIVVSRSTRSVTATPAEQVAGYMGSVLL
jgi:hypothetical protein